jgi:carboxyl-terminal processing protease
MVKLKPLLIAAIGLAFSAAHSQNCNKSLLVYNKMAEEHIEPKALDDSLSSKIFTLFFNSLDPSGIYFTKQDLKALSLYQFKLDEEIKQASCRFTSEVALAYKNKIARTRHRIDSLLKTPLDFSIKEFWDAPEFASKQFPDNQRGLVYNLRRKLKYAVLMTMSRQVQAQGKKFLLPEDFKVLSPKAQEKVRQSNLKKIDKLLIDLDTKSTVQNIFLKAMAKTFDPHSDFMTKEEMMEFQESLSSERQSFGIGLMETSLGEVKIGRLVPGGPAWKSGQLHQGDLLVRLTWEGREGLDLLDYDLEEVDALLHTVGESRGELTVAKATGELKTVTLIKEKIENTENSITGFVLTGKHKFGYIELPGFFTDESQHRLQGCANEISKEIIKLNRQKIEGLILDLRFNGGGSLQEAIELAGIFIDAGPVAVMQQKGSPAETLRDVNRGLAFSGPLIVLVNGASASASELVAAALQDHNRAIIVGGKTFGKATGQVLMPLIGDVPKDDFLKITVDRLFRINQASLQQIGVVPDFVLPDLGDLIHDREENLPHALARKTTDKKTYYTPSKMPMLDSLRIESKERVAANRKFNDMKNLVDLLTRPFPLQVQGFISSMKELTELVDAFAQDVSSNVLFEVSLVEAPLTADSNIEQTRKEIISSMYIQEAYSILAGIVNKKK